MRRFPFFFVLWSALALAQAPPPEQVQEPPEEDVSRQEQEKHEYTFNPLQSAKELKIGNFYMKKGSYKAAARRFEEATKWDPNSAEAWLRLGEAQAKLKDLKAARAAWSKYLELEPDGKRSASVRKKLDQL